MTALPKEIEAGATLAVSRRWETAVPQSATVTRDRGVTTFVLERPSLADVYTMARSVLADCSAADAKRGTPLLCQITVRDRSTLDVRIQATTIRPD